MSEGEAGHRNRVIGKIQCEMSLNLRRCSHLNRLSFRKDGARLGTRPMVSARMINDADPRWALVKVLLKCSNVGEYLKAGIEL